MIHPDEREPAMRSVTQCYCCGVPLKFVALRGSKRKDHTCHRCYLTCPVRGPECDLFRRATRPASVPLPPVAPAREIDLHAEHASPETVDVYRALERGHAALRAARVPS